MLRIRLQRMGRKNNPHFRFVVTDRRNSTKSGRTLETLGFFDYREKGAHSIDVARLKRWISTGAKPTDSVHNYLVSQKIIEGTKRNVLPLKSPPKKEEVVGVAKALETSEAASPTMASAPNEISEAKNTPNIPEISAV